ncbi:MAG: hypothetical protein QF437_10615 [Planctomycetota bacterium]|nr:hypothetical protein [Planctomycetota bacterium]
MKKVQRLLLAATILGTLTATGEQGDAFRQTYPAAPDIAAKNRRLVAQDLEKASAEWKQSPVVYYVVPPLSDIPRTPDRYPADGVALGPVEVIAAQGEFEPASLVVRSLKAVDRFIIRAQDLQGPDGATIPASALDIKLIKVWYQSGAAWYGYFADALGRRLVPELLVNDEDLIRVDCETRDNYVRYNNADGSVHHQWMSANFMVVNYSKANQANLALIKDAETLQPVVLNPDEFKQFFVTVGVPRDARDGVYTGNLDLLAEGRVIGSVPVRLRVLPFELPQPKTYYDQAKKLYLSLYGTAARNPTILRNLAEHNARHAMGFPELNPMNPDQFEADAALAQETGIATRPLFRSAPSANIRADQDNPTGEQQLRLKVLRKQIAGAAELCQKVLGHTDFYSYGVDEGGPDTIRSERAAWRTAHDAGGKVMVSTHPWRRLLFALDYMVMPGMPAEKRETEIRKFHEANPDSLAGWYANPHSGPENPNYFRRIQGMMTYKGNYDVSSNYCWWRNNWNDMATPYESYLRNLVMVQATRDDVLDSLAWEGVREGLDDIRYATKLKQLALQAMQSKNGDIMLLGRRALGYLAYWDEKRGDLDAFRYEAINYILRMEKALKGGKS